MGVFKVSRGRGQPQGKAREQEGSGNAAGQRMGRCQAASLPTYS